MSKGPQQIFLQGKYTNGQHAHEQMFNITNDQEKANQNHSAMSLYTQNGHYPKQTEDNKTWHGCGKIRICALRI